MSQETELRQVVADLLEIDPAGIGPDTIFGPRLSSSLARARLDAALRRRLGVQCPAVYTARRYGELEAAVLGREDASGESRGAQVTHMPPAASALTGAALAGVHCGIDIVEIDELPEAADYWEHEFYKASFADAEIAYCLAQTNPREHFAARWAAKEATKKLSSQYLEADFKDLEVTLRPDGAPVMKWRHAPLPVTVSLSHTRTAAIAMAIASAPVASMSVDSVFPRSESPPPPVRAGFFSLRRLLWALLLLAAAIVVWALLQSLGYSVDLGE